MKCLYVRKKSKLLWQIPPELFKSFPEENYKIRNYLLNTTIVFEFKRLLGKESHNRIN